MRETILEEWRLAYERSKKDTKNRIESFNEYISGNMNNFWVNIPRPAAKSYWEYMMSEEKLNSSRKQRSEQTHKVHSPKENPEKWIDDDKKGHSEKAWTQTTKEFLAEVDRGISESGVDRERLMAYVETRYGTQDRQSASPNSDIDTELLFPVYAKMREWGYTHMDLKG